MLNKQNNLNSEQKINPVIFHQYDVRGVYPSEFDERSAYAIARAFVIQQKVLKVILGRDARLSSPQIFAAVKKGLLDQGADVVEIGEVTTPLFYYVVARPEYKKAGGLMVTASHNPKEYNGIKMLGKNANKLSFEHGIEQIKDIAVGGGFSKPASLGRAVEKSFHSDYEDFLCSQIKTGLNGEKIIVDASNGAGGPIFGEIFRKLGLDFTLINAVPDGNFPAHSPNPLLEESQREIKDIIKKQKGEFRLGAIIDADADRCLFFDEKGEYVDPNNSVAALADHYTKPGGKKVVYTSNITKLIRDLAVRNGSSAVESRVGHVYLTQTSRKLRAVFAGEMSGHFYFKETKYFDDAIFAVIRMLEYLKLSGKKLSQINEEYSRGYVRTGEINIPLADKEKAIRLIESSFTDAKITRVDGISLEFGDVWLNARPSNTESLIRVTIEGKNRGVVESLKQKVMGILEKC